MNFPDKTLIIAEAGVNHNGQLDLAKKLIEVAANAGADYIKFQTFKADNLVSRDALKAEYQKKLTGKSESQYEMIKKLELSKDDHFQLKHFCDNARIKFLSSPFDNDSIDLLEELEVELYKIPSGEITNYPYLKKLAGLHKSLIISTGMSTMDEVGAALDILTKNGTEKEQIVILHANTEYPTPFDDVNLKAMLTMQETFGIKVGYSDHTRGIEIPIAATAMGASVIEKHFTLDHKLPGPDHKASLEPDELKQMVNAIRHTELALGNGIKGPSPSEKKNITVVRKSLYSRKAIKRGEPFTAENLIAKRPGDGLSPMMWKEIIGMNAKRDFEPNEKIEL